MIASLMLGEPGRGRPPHIEVIAENPREWETLRDLIGKYVLMDRAGKTDTDLPKDFPVGDWMGVRVPLQPLAHVLQPGELAVPKVREVEKEVCPVCDGDGRIYELAGGTAECPDCGGTGKLSWKGGSE